MHALSDQLLWLKIMIIKFQLVFITKRLSVNGSLKILVKKNVQKKRCFELNLALLLLVNSLVVHAYSDGFYYLRYEAAIQEIFCLVSCSLKKLVPKMLAFVEWALATFSCLWFFMPSNPFAWEHSVSPCIIVFICTC